MLSSMEGAVAIWRPDQCYQPLSDAIMHVEEPLQSGACISSKKSILPTLAVWYVVSCLNFFEIVEVQ